MTTSDIQRQALRGNAAKVGVIAGAAYGLALRLSIDLVLQSGKHTFAMFAGFLFVLPLVVGYLTVRPVGNPTWSYRIFAPWVTSALMIAAAALLGWEGGICIVFATPGILVAASIGGIVAAALPRAPGATPSMLLLPVAVMAAETRLPSPLRLETTTTPVSRVWPLVASVDTIRANERRPALFTAIGFPEPVAATLSRPGVGGVREASFTRGVVFHEVVTEWEPERRLRFTIDGKDVPPTALDEHVKIGGPFFDMLTGTYELTPLSANRTRITLSSDHRVSTHFNPYAAWWSRRIMTSIQRNILEVLRQRAER
jgi:hypothetical protein